MATGLAAKPTIVTGTEPQFSAFQRHGLAVTETRRAVSDHGIIADSPIDMAHLRRYTLGDRGLEKEVLDLFLAQLPSIIGALGVSETGDVRSRAAHTLKGSGRAVGAWRIAALAEDIEDVMRANSQAALQPLVDQIEAAVDDVRGFVDATYAVEIAG